MAHFRPYEKDYRAQKRIQGEDVFGNKIKVLSPSVRSYTGQRIRLSDRSFQQQPFNSVPPPPGFENRQPNAYPFNPPSIDPRDLRRNHQETQVLRTPPITLDRTAPNFRPIARAGLMGPPQMAVVGPPSVSPMEVSFEQSQGAVSRRTPGSRGGTPQEQLTAALGTGAGALPLYRRTHKISGSSEYSDSEVKGFVPSEFGTKTQGRSPVDLNISNLDSTMHVKELRRLLSNMIKEYAMILSLNVIVQADGSPVANIRVNSQQEAQFIISQLHRQKLGHKRIVISYAQTNTLDPEQLRVMVISVLQDVPDKRMPLFKFMEILESRYHCRVSVSEVNKLKDTVGISDEMGSRMISLTQGARVSPVHNSAQNMNPYCVIHCPKGLLQNRGWCELNSSYIPNVMMSLSQFAPKLMNLLSIHLGSMPLLSFQACYERECQEALPVMEHGVPLEHLITCVPNVEIKLVGSNKSIKVVRHEIRQYESEEEQVLKSVAPSLAPNLNLLCRELVDLLKTTDKCQLAISKFIPAYHQHFGRQCRVADYGYTKLLDLFEAVSHVVQIMGDSWRVLTLTHAAQMRRFTSDLLRVLKLQPNKLIPVAEFAGAFEKVLNKPFNPVEYGLCNFEDLLHEIPENTVALMRGDEGMLIAVPKREQTPEEVMRTKQFASEAIDLLRHSPYYTMLFNKFVPSYHHHFGHQCKVSDYGFAKLIELFEAIPDVVEIKELPDDERTVSLTPQLSLKILGSQVTQLIKNVGGGELKIEVLPILYFREFGYPLNPEVYQCDTITEVVEKLSDYVQVFFGNAGPLLRPIETDTLLNILRVRCWALLLGPPHVKDFGTFKYEYQLCYHTNFSMDSLKSICNVVSISSMNNTEFVSLTSLYVLAAQLYYVICSNGGSVVFTHLERLYADHYNKSLKLSVFNINSTDDFCTYYNLMFYIQGNKKRNIVVLNRNLQEHLGPLDALKCDNNNIELKAEQWGTLCGRGRWWKKKYPAPKPDSPTQGPSLWNPWSTPTKHDNHSLNFSINLPITLNPVPLGNPYDLISPARNLLPVWNPWTQSPLVAPEPHELPLPDKLLPKEGMSDDSGDSGVISRLENSPSDNENETSSSDNHGTSQKSFYGTFLDFK